MLLTIDEFRHRVDTDRATLVSELQELTGRYGAEEAEFNSGVSPRRSG
jgi:hypothetical protein